MYKAVQSNGIYKHTNLFFLNQFISIQAQIIAEVLDPVTMNKGQGQRHQYQNIGFRDAYHHIQVDRNQFIFALKQLNVRSIFMKSSK